jgi:purine-binding chemotaxis protein CheW
MREQSVGQKMEKYGVEEKGDRQMLVFNLVKEELGLDISCVREVLAPREIHPLPQTPDFIEGVINLRGHIIAVIDLGKKFNIKGTEDKAKRIIVCKVKNLVVGLLVNSVSEIISLSKEDIKPTPKVVSMQIEEGFISGIARLGERLIAVLNLEKVLTKDEVTSLSNIRQ